MKWFRRTQTPIIEPMTQERAQELWEQRKERERRYTEKCARCGFTRSAHGDFIFRACALFLEPSGKEQA